MYLLRPFSRLWGLYNSPLRQASNANRSAVTIRIDVPFSPFLTRTFELRPAIAESCHIYPRVELTRHIIALLHHSSLGYWLEIHPALLTFMSDSIVITHTVEFPDSWPPHGIDSIFPKPLSPTPYTLVPCTDRSFEIEQNLLVGESKWAQVYRGALHSSALGSLRDVVLKVYDEQQFPDFSGVPDDELPITRSALPNSDKRSYRLTGELMAWQETWAYKQLESMQGESIPTFYGVFQVKTKHQSGEDYKSWFAIAVSYVEGTPLLERCKQLGSWTKIEEGTAEWFTLIRDLHVVTHRMHELGVAHYDISSRNIIVSTSTGSLVLIDFAMCRPTRWPDPQDEKRHASGRGVEYDGNSIFRVVRGISGDEYLNPESPPRERRKAQQKKLYRWLFEFSEEPWFRHFKSACPKVPHLRGSEL